MKTFNVKILIFSLIILNFACSYKKDVLPISQKLIWRYNDTAQHGSWQHAIVPGSVFLSLKNDLFLPNNLYFDHFIQKIDYLSNKTWIFKSQLNYRYEITKRERVELIFNGLDTYTQIYVNGKFIGQTDNFFKHYRFDITGLLKKGKNEIIVKFLPPKQQALKFYKSLKYSVPDSYISVIRKPYFHLVHKYNVNYDPIGFSKSVFVQAWSKAKIRDIQFYTEKLNKSKASIKTKIQIQATDNYKANIQIESQYGLYINKQIKLQPGLNNFEFKFQIDSPQIWYPKNFGPQNIYQFKTTLRIGSDIYDIKNTKYGLRNIKISTKNHQIHIFVNDSLIPFKAVELLPLDVELTNEQDKYPKLFKLLNNANINIIVTWDKGHYFLNDFYDMCDKNGILVIQTFMLPVKILPPKDTVAKIFMSELQQTIKDLRHHPSIIAWYGNYNPKQIKKQLQKHYKGKKLDELFSFSNLLFTGLIPKIVKDNDNRPYLANLNFKNLWISPTKSISMPKVKTIEKIAPYQSITEAKNIYKFYTKPSDTLFDQILNIIQKYKVENLENICYLSQLQQEKQFAKQLQQAIINPDYDSYLISWFNDITPTTISPSAIANINNLKAKYFAIKNLFKPFIITIDNKDQYINTQIYSHYDTANLLVYYKLNDLNGNLLWQKINKERLFNHKTLQTFDMGAFFKLFSKDTLLFKIEVYHNLTLVAEKYHYFKPIDQLNLKPPKITAKIYPIDMGYALEITPENFLAKSLYIELSHNAITPSDNFFDILPDETKTILLYTPYQIKNITRFINIFSLYEATQDKQIPENHPEIKQETSSIPNFKK